MIRYVPHLPYATLLVFQYHAQGSIRQQLQLRGNWVYCMERLTRLVPLCSKYKAEEVN